MENNRDTAPPQTDALRPSLRVIHLSGGNRAYDFAEPIVQVGPDILRPHLTISEQPYDQIYRTLYSIGLEPVGVDFITNSGPAGSLQPPDFQPITSGSGFSTVQSERAWADVKNVSQQKTPEIVDFSERFTTYHRLLTLRVRDLSEAYRGCLLATLTDIDGRPMEPANGTLFSNGYQTYIEAALHAFLADAASLRDLIGEAVWRLVLKAPSRDVTSFGSFLKRTRTRANDHPLIAELLVAAGDGGWINVLTELRNSVVHVAPLANTHELHMTQVRLQPLRGGTIPVAHYPLTTSDWKIRPRPGRIDFDEQEGSVRRRIEAYRDFVNQSGDALTYACNTLGQLVALAARVRQAAGLDHKIRTITSADIIGPIRVFKPTAGPRTAGDRSGP